MFLSAISFLLKFSLKSVFILSSLLATFQLGSQNGKMDLSKKYSEQKLLSQRQEILDHFSYLAVDSAKKESILPILSVLRNFENADREALLSEFDIAGNVDLDSAQVLLFSENHNNNEIKARNFELIAKLARPGDVILFETYEKELRAFDVIFRDLTDCTYPGLLNATQINSQIAAVGELADEFKPSLPFSLVNATGWDLKIEYAKHNKIGFMTKELAHMATDPNGNVASRNAALEHVLQKLACRRIFVIAGAYHLPSAYAYAKVPGMKGALDAVSELLRPYPHVILTMKDFDPRGGFETALAASGTGFAVAGMVAVVSGALWAASSVIVGPSKMTPSLLVTAGMLAGGAYIFSGTSHKNETQLNYDHLDKYCPKPSET